MFVLGERTLSVDLGVRRVGRPNRACAVVRYRQGSEVLWALRGQLVQQQLLAVF